MYVTGLAIAHIELSAQPFYKLIVKGLKAKFEIVLVII